MKKIYIFFMASVLALGAISCSKDDGGSTNNNNGGGGGGGTTPVDVWAKSLGSFKGKVVTSMGGEEDDMTVTVTKINDLKIKLTPGPENTKMKEIEVPVYKGDTSLYNIQGSFQGSFYIIANSNPPIMVLDDKTNNVTYFGSKQ